MADQTQTPGEANVARDGAQLNVHEARAVADDRGTVRGPAGQGGADRAIPDDLERDAIPLSNEPAQHPAYADSETALGGADSVEKTTYGVGHGADPVGTREYAPVGERKGEGPVVANVASGGGVSPLAWVVGAIALLALLLYSVNIFRR